MFFLIFYNAEFSQIPSKLQCGPLNVLVNQQILRRQNSTTSSLAHTAGSRFAIQLTTHLIDLLPYRIVAMTGQ